MYCTSVATYFSSVHHLFPTSAGIWSGGWGAGFKVTCWVDRNCWKKDAFLRGRDMKTIWMCVSRRMGLSTDMFFIWLYHVLRVAASSKQANLGPVSIKIDISIASLSLSSNWFRIEEKHFGDWREQGNEQGQRNTSKIIYQIIVVPEHQNQCHSITIEWFGLEGPFEIT